MTSHGTFAVTGAGKAWQASITPKGDKAVVLAEGVSHTTAYLACTKPKHERVAAIPRAAVRVTPGGGSS